MTDFNMTDFNMTDFNMTDFEDDGPGSLKMTELSLTLTCTEIVFDMVPVFR